MSYYQFQRAAYPYAKPYEDDPKRKSCPPLLASICLTGQNLGDRHPPNAHDRGAINRDDSGEVSKLCPDQFCVAGIHKAPDTTGLLPKPVRNFRDQK
ncbi:MAG: hypothetical protein [Caudoviricetes sp.]|nr:MAG: hypothetical protein [Caudoviricetes sp.]